MSRLNLTASQRRRLRRQLVQTLDARVLRRTLAVLEFDQGRPAAEIARLLGVTRQSVYNWIESYRRIRKPEALQDQPGRGRRPTLDEDEEHLLEALLARSPREFEAPQGYWTVPLLQDLLEMATGRRHSEETLRRALHRLGYVWKRPRYDLEPDPQRDKKTSNSSTNTGFARAERGVGPGRNRTVALPAAASGVVAARASGSCLAEWPQCPTGDFRGHELAHRHTAVRPPREGPQRRLSSLSPRGPRALSGLACGPAAGRKSLPYRPGIFAKDRGNDVVVAAQAVAEIEPHRHSVGTGQRRDHSQPAVRQHRRASRLLPGTPLRIVQRRGAAYFRRTFQTVLA